MNAACLVHGKTISKGTERTRAKGSAEINNAYALFSNLRFVVLGKESSTKQFSQNSISQRPPCSLKMDVEVALNASRHEWKRLRPHYPILC